jgi:hypothetical protein
MQNIARMYCPFSWLVAESLGQQSLFDVCRANLESTPGPGNCLAKRARSTQEVQLKRARLSPLGREEGGWGLSWPLEGDRFKKFLPLWACWPPYGFRRRASSHHALWDDRRLVSL